MRQRLIIFIQAASLFLAALSVLVGFQHFAGWSLVGSIDRHINNVPFVESNGEISDIYITSSKSTLRDGNATLLQNATPYIKAIMFPQDDSFNRLACPAPSHTRYEYLRANTSAKLKSSAMSDQPQYLFALNIHQKAKLLPRLLGSIVESIRFLGPENCVLSIVEGRSDDGTFEILKLLRPPVEEIGVRYFFNSTDLNPTAGNRIEILAQLRNQALQPLRDHPEQYSTNTTVVFLNDVSICMEDILELIHQRLYQKADMTCAMDWTYVGQDPTFYDVWIARGMNGDSFFDIPEDGNWNSAWNLFWNNPESQQRFNDHKPFQVFSCWNGATAFTAQPLLKQEIRFRGPFQGECYQGEPQLFCKEMWHLGYGKIAVVPAVNIEYSDEAARRIKALKGYVSKWVSPEGNDDPSWQIEWELKPPGLVKCLSSYVNQTWVAWDEYLK